MENKLMDLANANKLLVGNTDQGDSRLQEA